MRRSNRIEGTKAFHLDEITRGKVSLKFVLACYEGDGYSTFFEMAQASNGVLTSFVALDINSLHELVKKLARLVNMSGSNKLDLKSEEPFSKEVLWLTSFGTLVYRDRPKKKTIMSYKGKSIELMNLPSLVYVISEGRCYVYEEIKAKEETIGYIPANLPNISHFNGSVCMGNTFLKTKGLSINEIINQSFKSFWDSSFTSHSDSTGNDWAKGIYNYKSRKDIKPKTLKEIVESC